MIAKENKNFFTFSYVKFIKGNKMSGLYANLTKEDYVKAKTDEKAFEKVFRANQGLISFCIGKYSSCFDERFNHGEYESELMFGLYKAIMTYEPGRYNFSTYATQIMLNEVKMLTRKNNSKKEQTFTNSLCFDAPISTDICFDEDKFLGELISDGSYENEQQELMEEFPDIQRLYSTVPENVRTMFEKLSKGESQLKIAESLGISQSKISRLIVKVGENINHFLKVISEVKCLTDKGLDEETIAKELDIRNAQKVKYLLDSYNYLYNDGPYVEITENWTKRHTPHKAKSDCEYDEKEIGD